MVAWIYMKWISMVAGYHSPFVVEIHSSTWADWLSEPRLTESAVWSWVFAGITPLCPSASFKWAFSSACCKTHTLQIQNVKIFIQVTWRTYAQVSSFFLQEKVVLDQFPDPFTSLRIAAGLGMELWKPVVQFVQVLYCWRISALYPNLYSEKHLTYIQF